MSAATHEDLQALIAAVNNQGRSGGPPGPMDRRYSATGRGKEVILQPIWDRQNIATAVPASVTLFTQAQGSSAVLIRAGATATVQKTLRDTNLTTQGVIPDKTMDVRGISLHLIPLQHAIAGAATPKIPDDKATLYETGYFEFKASSKSRLTMPLLPFAALDPDSAATTASSTTIFSRAGVGGFIYPLAEDAVVIEANVPFTFVVYFDGAPTISQSFDLLVILHAYVERMVQ
jgi:hypothetical protein